MRIFSLLLLSYFCVCMNVSAKQWESPETYVAEDGKFIALSKDEYYRRHHMDSMDEAVLNDHYSQVIEYIDANKPVTTDQINRLVEEKYNDSAELYAMLAFFWGEMDNMTEDMSDPEHDDGDLAPQDSKAPADEKDFKMVEYYFLRAIDKSQDEYFTAMYALSLSSFYKNPSNPLYNTDKWRTYLTRAAELGMGKARFQLGASYLSGDDVPQDSQKAYEWLKKAADDNDDYYALVLLSGILLERGDGGPYPNFPYDNAELIRYSQKSIDLYNLNGAYGLIALAYQMGGKNMKPDHQKAFENAEKCVNIDGWERCYSLLGKYYRDGIGTEVDVAKAREMFQKAVDKGDKEAEQLLQSLSE